MFELFYKFYRIFKVIRHGVRQTAGFAAKISKFLMVKFDAFPGFSWSQIHDFPGLFGGKLGCSLLEIYFGRD